MKKSFISIMLFFCLLLGGTSVLAARTAVVKKCEISASDSTKVIVEATATGVTSGTDGYYYLFALQPYEKTISAATLQVGKVKQGAPLYFSVPLNLQSTKSVFYRKFVIAVKKNSKYTIISNARYITNPERLAKVTKAFPTATSKKGLHIQPTMISDAEDLGIKHAAVNICLDLFITNSKSNAVAYTYQGKTYYFSKVGCNEVDKQTKQLSESNVIISGILLLRENGAGKLLVPPKARGTGRPYYGFNTQTKEGTETLEALLHFLGDRYMNSGGKYGTIVNWIVGNEVNDYYGANYMGDITAAEYVDAYTRSFRICDMALRSVYKNARVYISLNHLWNLYQPHGKCLTSKDMLNGFAAKIKEEGQINWNLAFHPYPAPLTDPNFWNDNVTYSDDTLTVTMKNLDYLSDYVKKHFPSDVRIILSEQGFTSKSNGTTNEYLQAAAYAYAYYLTEFNDKVDSFIMNRHVDHQEETKQGLYLGTWTNTSGHLEYANKKKVIWNVFKYIDSSRSQEVTEFALKYLPGNSWESLVKGFKWNRFLKMGDYKDGKITTDASASKTTTIANNLRYSYNGTAKKKGTKTTVKVSSGVNPVIYSGAGWRFPNKLDFSVKNKFSCKLQVTGLRENYAHVRIRFFSGNNVYETSTKLAAGKTKTVSVNLSKWSNRKSVDKIQIWVCPYKHTKWKNGKIVISNMKQSA